ncbi:MAG: dephospho-CoA kinase [Chthoniobacter sp.]
MVPDVIDQDGRPDRARLRKIVFANPARRRQLEQILHPIIRDRWMGLAGDAARSDHWFCADIPCSTRPNAQSHFAAVIVVACAPTHSAAGSANNANSPTKLPKTSSPRSSTSRPKSRKPTTSSE